MTRYLIKTTYISGAHQGHEYLLRKGGYVTDKDSIEWDDTTYQSENIVKRVCKKLTEDNALDHQIESQDRERRIASGKTVSDYWIHDLQSYEPYAVEVQ